MVIRCRSSYLKGGEKNCCRVSSLKWTKLISSLLQFIFSIVTAAAVLKAKPRLNWSFFYYYLSCWKMMGPTLLFIQEGVLGVGWVGGCPRAGGGKSIYRRSIFWKQRPRISPLTCLLRVRAPLIQLIREMHVFARLWGGGFNWNRKSYFKWL